MGGRGKGEWRERKGGREGRQGGRRAPHFVLA